MTALRWRLVQKGKTVGWVGVPGEARQMAQRLANQTMAPVEVVRNGGSGYRACVVRPEPYCDRCDLYSPHVYQHCIGCGGEVR